MNKPLLALTTFAVVLLLVVSSPAAADDNLVYYWSNYERDMWLAYRQPDDEDRQLKLAATMLRIITESDKAGRKPPPGIVAEYGYFLFQRGEYYAAIDHFRREANSWPESAALMERMIRRAQEEAGS